MWIAWLVAAIALVGAEMVSLDLFLAMLGIGALAGMLVALFGGPFLLQVLAAAVVALLMILFVRPLAVRHLRPPATATGVDALVGKEALVLDHVDQLRGRVKIGGEVWSARSEGAGAYQPGAWVTVQRIDGATAVVTDGDKA
jgi:membrane protein implicated in regulation of membrane protease activity